MSSTLVFDMRTIPDVDGLRMTYGLPDELSDREVAEFAFQRRRAAAGRENLPPHYQRIICISCLVQGADGSKFHAFAEPELSEAEIIRGFVELLLRGKHELASWDGARRLVPVLLSRALIAGVSLVGEASADEFEPVKQSNVEGLLLGRHVCLEERLGVQETESTASLQEIALLSGIRLNPALTSDRIWEAYQQGDFDPVCQDCEADVLKAHLLLARLKLARGLLSRQMYDNELARWV